jgi:hypothetical protein
MMMCSIEDMKEIDLIISIDDKLYPTEIKKSMNPTKSMFKSFSVLKKALGFTVENELILCLVENKIWIDITTIAFPIKSI